MQIPFTAEQFFDIFRQYNEAVWPAQVALTLLAIVATGLVALYRSQGDRLISGILGLLWAWTGVAYHLAYFSVINKAAFAFGALFLAGSAGFLWAGVIKGQLAFASTARTDRVLGGILLAYALLIYPVLSMLSGHSYPTMPTFGLPCPTTIFTIGMLCFLAQPFPKYILVAPILWAAVGSQAAILFSVYADIGLLVAGVVAIYLFARASRANAKSGPELHC